MGALRAFLRARSCSHMGALRALPSREVLFQYGCAQGLSFARGGVPIWVRSGPSLRARRSSHMGALSYGCAQGLPFARGLVPIWVRSGPMGGDGAETPRKLACVG